MGELLDSILLLFKGKLVSTGIEVQVKKGGDLELTCFA
jgi:hypothetical protein